MDTRLIPLAALQHYAFCPRQCALIHNEQAWAENYLTASGQQLHERVDGFDPETRKGIRYERGVSVSAPLLGLIGKLDLLEVDIVSGSLHPVEYKRGKPKKNDVDAVQLCAQALCLEEMRNLVIESGALWYGQTRHRLVVLFDERLRQKTIGVIEQVKAILFSGITPKAEFTKSCKACSLVDLCQPQKMSVDRSAQYFNRLFEVNHEEPDQ